MPLRRTRRAPTLGFLHAIFLTESRRDFWHRLGTEFCGDCQEFLTISITAIHFIKAAGCITRPADNGRARENIMHQRSGLSAVQQAGAGFGCETNDHESRFSDAATVAARRVDHRSPAEG